jgi:hypothetical protein
MFIGITSVVRNSVAPSCIVCTSSEAAIFESVVWCYHLIDCSGCHPHMNRRLKTYVTLHRFSKLC